MRVETLSMILRDFYKNTEHADRYDHVTLKVGDQRVLIGRQNNVFHVDVANNLSGERIIQSVYIEGLMNALTLRSNKCIQMWHHHPHKTLHDVLGHVTTISFRPR